MAGPVPRDAQSVTVVNPILRGFSPDPSVVRVDGWYYTATSSFEWAPGVPIHRSRDLVDWEFAGAALTGNSWPTMLGIPDSAGVWAPNISHSDDMFWLATTVVYVSDSPYKDMQNILLTAADVRGPWSDPIPLNNAGFDPSFFHDDDGRHYLAQMVWDHRPGRSAFAGIALQEFDATSRRLVGEFRIIHTADDLIEGPNLVKYGGYYYLVLAQGGTGTNHGVSVARSTSAWGPYEADPQHSVMTSRDDHELPLQKAGHGDLVQMSEDEWLMVHLASRPVRTERGDYCVLGRETCVQRVVLSDDGWFRLGQGSWHPALRVNLPLLTVDHREQIQRPDNVKMPDDGWQPNPQSGLPGWPWSTLREEISASWASLTARPGWLRLRGRHSPDSRYHQSLLARRIQEQVGRAEVTVSAAPAHYTQMCGLILFYDTSTYYYLRLGHDEQRGRIIELVDRDCGVAGSYEQRAIPAGTDVRLRAAWSGSHLGFEYRLVPNHGSGSESVTVARWESIGPSVNMTRLSDDYGDQLRFTGAMVGICVQDLGEQSFTADFSPMAVSFQCEAAAGSAQR